MECNELLEQEEAFHKLNAEIELRTRQLMKNVEAVINKQTSLHWTSGHLEEKYSLCTRTQKRNGVSPNFNNGNLGEPLGSDTFDNPFDRGEYNISRQALTTGYTKANNDQKRKEQNKKGLSDALIPSCAKGMSAESLVRFLKAKGKLLQEELEQLKRQLQIKNEELKKIHQEIKNRDDEKQRHLADIGALRDKLKKIELNSASQAEKLHMSGSENRLLKKEIEMLKQDVKRFTQGTAGNEAKFNKWREETEKLKLLLKQSESNEKEAREKCRIKNDEMVAMIRKMEKQKSDLVSAIKKQVVLVGNLKKQKELLEMERGVNYTEKELLKMLEENRGNERN